MKKRNSFPLPFVLIFFSFILGACGGGGGNNNNNGVPSQNGTIQISQDDELVFVVNEIGTVNPLAAPLKRAKIKGSLSIVQALVNQQDINTLSEEILVGCNPRSVSVRKDKTKAFVSNGGDGTVSVINVGANGTPSQVVATITVGSEPRGTALTPNGEKLYVANFSDGTVTVVDAVNNSVLQTINLQFQFDNVEDPIRLSNPYAIGITDDGDGDDDDEKVYVADFFARGIETRDIDQREGLNAGKEGRIAIIDTSKDVVEDVITLGPVNAGFNGEDVFFNQFYTISFNPDNNRFYLPTVGASPEAPLRFDSNVQALVGVVNIDTNEELREEHVNLNNIIRDEVEPIAPFDENNPTRLDRVFAGDTVALAIRGNAFVFVSRAGSYAMRGLLSGENQLTLDNPGIRFAVGNIPTGVVLNSTGTRAYVYSEVSASMTSIDLNQNIILATVNTAELPAVGTEEHQLLLGKLAFFTGMGVPAENLADQSVRNIDTHRFRNVASNSNWSSCASCHPDGLVDGVTWIFGTGPRQSIPLDGSFSPNNPDNDRRVLNWNAVRGSITDFNQNARNVQGGHGFSPGALAVIDNNQAASEVEDARFSENHGPDENTLIQNNNPPLNRVGLSDSLNLITLWAKKGIRTLNRPSNLNEGIIAKGRAAFGQFCASCHGGDKWTSSRILWDTPLFFDGSEQGQKSAVVQIDTLQGRAVVAFDQDKNKNFETPIVQQNLGTLFLNTNPIEKRANGNPSVNGNVSFNPPSLLGVANTSPYGHHGRAETLEEVFLPLEEDGLSHDNFGASQDQINDIVEFLKSIDSNQTPVLLGN